MVADRTVDWAIVAAIVLCLLVIPAVLIWAPPPLPYRLSFLILPLIPAVGLALVGLWFALRRRGSNPNP